MPVRLVAAAAVLAAAVVAGCAGAAPGAEEPLADSGSTGEDRARSYPTAAPDHPAGEPSEPPEDTAGSAATPPDDARPTAPPCDDPLGCYGTPRLAGTFDVEAVPEASGLAASRRNPGVLYLLDDRPGTSEVWAIAVDGAMLGPITVAGLEARDTESLAVGPCDPDDGEPCVYVGDIGDNLRSRDAITVHRFREPDLADGVPAHVAADRARWTYPDGPHDAEALLVGDAGTPFVVTKAPFDVETGETGETRLYRAPGFADGVLTDLGVLPVPAPEAPLHSLLVGNVVTGGDYRDGRVLLRTYDQVLEYVAPAPDADLATLADWTVRTLPSPFEPQSEAIAWGHAGPSGADPEGAAPGGEPSGPAPPGPAAGCGYFTAGEGTGDLWHVPCAP